jgi:hypothetical protein
MAGMKKFAPVKKPSQMAGKMAMPAGMPIIPGGPGAAPAGLAMPQKPNPLGLKKGGKVGAKKR